FSNWIICDSAIFEFTVIEALAYGGYAEWVLDGEWGGSAEQVPDEFNLFANYPNPFNASTVITYDLPVSCNARLEVYNVMGQKVATLVEEFKSAGHHTVNWNASDYSSGVYFYKLTADDYIQTKRMTLLK
ncbi:MAG: T9SS type A sorting domain-containing protein, partial [candidate division Zixibacteria bacterium]|nr:T9SS type A sorting domain-containing protein [candidate division Zixibacteria bacterium]